MWPQIDVWFFELDSFTVMRALAIIAGIGTFWWQWKDDAQLGVERWPAALYVLGMTAMAAVAGTKLWELLRLELFTDHAIDSLRFSQASPWYFAGFTATFAGAAAALWLVRVPIAKGFDLLAPGVAAGHGLQRVGCFLAGDGCYGIETSLPWGMAFPDGTVPINIPVHPTMLYEAVLMIPLFAVLWLRRGRWPAGVSFSICLIATGSLAFLLHFIQLAPPVMLGMTETQLFSMLLVPLGGFTLYFTLADSGSVFGARSIGGS